MPDLSTTQSDYTQEARTLFAGFAQRHGLIYDADKTAPVEVCWRFPTQAKLSPPLTLALQNGDELNFGVGGFWSYFFPFPEVAAEFQHILDAWIAGEARVLTTSPWGRSRQLREDGRWQTVYRAGQLIPSWRPRPKTVQNRTGPDE